MNKEKAHFAQTMEPFYIGYEKRTKPYSIFHYHNSYEIYYLIQGERMMTIEDRKYAVRKGDLVFIAPGENHKSCEAGSYEHERYVINFEEGFLKPDQEELDLLSIFRCENNVMSLNLNEQNYILNLMSRMNKEYERKQYGYKALVRSLLTELLIFAVRYYQYLESYPPEQLKPLEDKVMKAVEYIRNHYMQDISLVSLARHLFISANYLSKIFKDTTGYTFISYLNNVRIKESQRLLKETSLSIEQIARKVGYGSATHFERVFKNHTGTTPIKFRKAEE